MMMLKINAVNAKNVYVISQLITVTLVNLNITSKIENAINVL